MQLSREFIDILKHIHFSFLFPSLAESQSELQITLLHHLKRNTHSKRSRSEYNLIRQAAGLQCCWSSFPPMRGNLYHREESGRAQKHMIGWHPWPHTHSDATRWLPHTPHTHTHLMAAAHAELTDGAGWMLPPHRDLCLTDEWIYIMVKADGALIIRQEVK